MTDTRITEKYNTIEGTWETINFDDLKMNDIFRMFESESEPAHDGDMWQVELEPFNGGVGCHDVPKIVRISDEEPYDPNDPVGTIYFFD